ncbi:MAG: hypothetical protein JNM17_13185 [Archangium sp.]|nr:hypothetical protein [Archangium sp.]
MGRYLRAGTPLNAACPTCGEAVIGLRWCHEERCAAWQAERRRRSIIASLALLFAVFLAFVAFPAHAQTPDPGKIQEGFVTAPIATIAFLEFLAIAYLFRELRAVERSRIADLVTHFERLIAYGDQVAKLSHTALGAVEVVERLSDKVQEQQKAIDVLQRQLAAERARRPA